MGQLGAKSVMRSVRLVAVSGRILKVSFESCNLNYVSKVFDRNEPGGVYDLDMSGVFPPTVLCNGYRTYLILSCKLTI